MPRQRCGSAPPRSCGYSRRSRGRARRRSRARRTTPAGDRSRPRSSQTSDPPESTCARVLGTRTRPQAQPQSTPGRPLRSPRTVYYPARHAGRAESRARRTARGLA